MHALFNERVNESLVSLVRLLLLVAGGLAVLASGGSEDVRLLGLAAGYFVFALVCWLLLPSGPAWVGYLTTCVDVSAVAVFSWLLPAGYPIWLLYVFPLLSAGSKGFRQTLAAGVSSIIAYFALAVNGPEVRDSGMLWPAAIIALLTACAAVLPSAWLSSAKERLAWGEVRAARKSLKLEQALGRAALQLATLDLTAAYEAASTAVRAGLDAAAFVSEPSSSQAVEDEAEASRLSLPLPTGATLVVLRDASSLDAEEHDWLRRLAVLLARTLQRIASYRAHCDEEERLRQVWQSSPLPAVLHDAHGHPVYANAEYQALGLSSVQPVQSADASGWLEVRIGDPPRVFVLMQAPVAEGQYQLTLYREVTEERNALQARDDLLSLVGHELRGPLASIHGFGQMMVRNLGVVQQQVAQLDRLIGDLMSKPALETGQLSLDLQDVRVDDFARKAAEQFRAAHQDRELRLNLHEVAPVRADPARLSQILGNLLANAAKYSPPDKPIEVGVEMRDGEVVMLVRDYGAGIAPEYIPHLFERYYRVPEKGVQQAKGLGLGLSIVRHLAMAHGGRVWVESAGPGKGSTFYVSLPASCPSVSSAA